MNDFEDALHEHLAALQARDIARFAATIGAEPCVVDGTGGVVRGRAAVLRSHEEWFASPDAWRFEYALRFRRDLGSAGVALIDVTYTQTEASAPARFLLSLVFERASDGCWTFVYDQNTPLAATAV